MSKFEVVLAGRVVGLVDPETLNARDIYDVEAASTFPQLVDWLETRAGADREDVLDAFAQIPLREVGSILAAVRAAVQGAIRVPNPSAPSSAAPSRPAGRARPGGSPASSTASAGAVRRGKSPERP